MINVKSHIQMIKQKKIVIKDNTSQYDVSLLLSIEKKVHKMSSKINRILRLMNSIS